MKEDYNSPKKISRRKFLSKAGYATKVVGAGTAYGILGNIIGRVYETERDALRNIERRYEEAAENLNPKTWYNKLLGKPTQRKRKVEIEPETRRGFIKNALHLYHEHPIPAFTSTGVAYGAGKSAVKGYEAYRNRLDKLQDELAHAQHEKQIVDLTHEIRDLKRLIVERFPQQSKLERGVNEEAGNELMALGFAGILISFILISINITGNVSNLNNSFDKPVIGILIFIISLITISIGTKKKKIKTCP